VTQGRSHFNSKHFIMTWQRRCLQGFPMRREKESWHRLLPLRGRGCCKRGSNSVGATMDCWGVPFNSVHNHYSMQAI
jgi:hypothetical protein